MKRRKAKSIFCLKCLLVLAMGLIAIAALLMLFSLRAKDPATKQDEITLIPVKVFLINDTSSNFSTKRSMEDVSKLLSKNTEKWHKKGINFDVQGIEYLKVTTDNRSFLQRPEASSFIDIQILKDNAVTVFFANYNSSEDSVAIPELNAIFVSDSLDAQTGLENRFAELLGLRSAENTTDEDLALAKSNAKYLFVKVKPQSCLTGAPGL